MAQTEFEQAVDIVERLTNNIETVVRGKTDKILLVLTAVLARGHPLLEDVPGTAKTILARAIQQSIGGASFARIQGTPDVLPSDITGLSIYNQKTKIFEFHPGPVMHNIVLVDEINRVMPKTQSALLEAMAERQVTGDDGIPRKLPEPFLLMATENPIEHEGTHPLPEAQIDRFFLKTALGYPGKEDELAILDAQQHGHPLGKLEAVVTIDEVLSLQRIVEDVELNPILKEWIVDFVRATREEAESDEENIGLGASVRGSLALDRATRAWALLNGRNYVEPEDIEILIPYVLGHRIILPNRVKLEEFLNKCRERAPRPNYESVQQ